MKMIMLVLTTCLILATNGFANIYSADEKEPVYIKMTKLVKSESQAEDMIVFSLCNKLNKTCNEIGKPSGYPLRVLKRERTYNALMTAPTLVVDALVFAVATGLSAAVDYYVLKGAMGVGVSGVLAIGGFQSLLEGQDKQGYILFGFSGLALTNALISESIATAAEAGSSSETFASNYFLTRAAVFGLTITVLMAKDNPSLNPIHRVKASKLMQKVINSSISGKKVTVANIFKTEKILSYVLRQVDL